MRRLARHCLPLALIPVLLAPCVAQAQTPPIDPNLVNLTTLKDGLGFSIDPASSKIGLHIKRPVLELLLRMKYGPSWTRFGAEKNIVKPSSFWEAVFTVFTFTDVNRVWQEDNIRNLALNGVFDVPNQTMPIRFDTKGSFFADVTVWVMSPFGFPVPFRDRRKELADVTADVTGTLQAKLDAGEFKFEINNLASSNESVTGLVPNMLSMFLFPFPLGPSPGISLVNLYGFTHWTQLLDGPVEDQIQKKNGVTIPEERVNLVRTWVNDFFQTVFGFQGTLLTMAPPVLDSEGLWIYYTYSTAELQQVFDRIMRVARDLGILDTVDAYLQVQNTIAMSGFDLTKLDSTKDTLIIGLSGAGVYPQVVAAGQPLLQTYATPPASPVPLYGDGIYPLPASYVDAKTVAVIGTPWPASTSGSWSDPDTFLGPDPVQFAARVKTALSLMAPGSRLILVGKSMGGCKMQQIAQELNSISVNVDALVIVDGSCMPGDQSATIKTILPNVGRVYNFRQTMAFPENDIQNGFQLGWGKPTIGYDRVVSDEALPAPMCPGIGHDDIDECPAVLAEIDRVIRGMKADPNAPGMPKLAVWMLNEAQHEQNVIKPRVGVYNNGDAPVSNFKVYTYFSVEDGMTPDILDWYSPESTPTLEKIGPTNYRVVYDYTGLTLAPGGIAPNAAGNVVGIYYAPNWPVMDKSLNYSYTTNTAFTRAQYVDIQLEGGTYLFSNARGTGSSPNPGEVVLTGTSTVIVPPEGVVVRVPRPNAAHGLMFTVRNNGLNDNTRVEWLGVQDQNDTACSSRTALLSGNGAQINNVATPKNSSGEAQITLRSQDARTYTVTVEVFDWNNGTGCRP